MVPLVQVIHASRKATKRHERIAFAEDIVARVGPLLERYVRARCREDGAEDTFQEVLIAIAKGYSRFRGRTDSQFFSWCYCIAHNKVVDRIRRKVAQPTTSLDVPEIRRAVEATAVHSPIGDEEREVIEEILEMLRVTKPPCVDYLKARFIEGLDYPELADNYGSTPDAMRMNVNRCLALARKLIKQTS